MSRYTPRHPRPRSTLGSPLMLQALGAAGAMITDEYLWAGWDPPKREVIGYDMGLPEVGPIEILAPGYVRNSG